MEKQRKVNINTLSKRQKEIYLNGHCQHRHKYIEHPNCFLTEKHIEQRIGFLDIEGSNLVATFGIVFSYCIKELNGKLISRSISPKDIKERLYDKNLLKQFIEDCKKFDKLIVYYGGDKRYDLPFLRTRALYWKLKFPQYKDLFLVDVWPIMRNKYKFHSNRLGVICTFLGIPSKEHPLVPDVWFRAMGGNEQAIKYIVTHNKEDVYSLEELYKRVIMSVKFSNNSL